MCFRNRTQFALYARVIAGQCIRARQGRRTVRREVSAVCSAGHSTGLRHLHLLRLWVVGLLFLTTSAHALDPNRLISQYGHTVWRSEEGLVPPSAEITQTADGYIWIASKRDLWRFDGAQFIPWLPPKGSRPLSTINSLLGARDGSLWIGMVVGVARLKNGNLSTYTKPNDLFGISKVIEDHAGNIWMTRYGVPHGGGGICEIAGDGLRCYGESDGFSASYGLGIAEDQEGNLFVAGHDSLLRWKPGTKASNYLSAVNQPGVEDVAVDHTGGIWAAMNAAGARAGVRYFHNGAWSDYSIAGFRSSNLHANTVFVDSAGAVWFGTANNGLYRVWMGSVDHFSRNDGLSGNAVNKIFEDREGDLWVATENGIDLFRNTPVITYSMDQGLSTDTVLTVLPLRDGTIWTGNFDAEPWAGEEPASILQAGTNRFSSGPKVPGKIGALFQDHSGALWLGLSGGMAVYRQGRVERVVGKDGKVLDRRNITAIIEYPMQSILAVNPNGLLRIQGQRVIEEIPLPKHLNTSAYLALSPDGGVWIAAQREGVMLYKDGAIRQLALPKSKEAIRIRSVFADTADPLLLATTIGLLRWDGRRWGVLDEAKGLPCARTLDMIKDRQGSLWMQADCGLLKADASDLQRWRQNPESRVPFTVFNALDGAQTGSIRVVQPTISLAPDGRVWFANAHKVGVIDPDHLYINPLPPPVHIEQLIADDKPFASSGQTRIPPNPRNVEIDYTALSYMVPQRVKFRYFLEGHDKTWQGPVTRRQAFYTDLPPGIYRFHVTACNNSGVWNNVGAVTEFVVEPMFYQTIWFKFLVSLAMAGLLWTLYVLRMRRATANVQRRLFTQIEERERIARELHDTLLQGFQMLVLRFQAITDTISSEHPSRSLLEDNLFRAERTLEEGRDRVNILRSETSTSNDLASELAQFGREMSAGSETQFQLTIEGSPTAIRPIVYEEIRIIAREAITNSFRHANAGLIECVVRFAPRHFSFICRDDGCGIPEGLLGAGTKDGHWGLVGMNERAEKLDAVLHISRGKVCGTEVELKLKASITYAASAHSRLIHFFSIWNK